MVIIIEKELKNIETPAILSLGKQNKGIWESRFVRFSINVLTVLNSMLHHFV